MRRLAETMRHVRRKQAKSDLLRGIEFDGKLDVFDDKREPFPNAGKCGLRAGLDPGPGRSANQAQPSWLKYSQRHFQFGEKTAANNAMSSTERARNPTLASRGTRIFEPPRLVKPELGL